MIDGLCWRVAPSGGATLRRTVNTPTIQLHSSNRTEALLEALASVVSVPLGDPLQPEIVVAQGRGMAVWLSQELSRRLGIWSNAELHYPRRLVQTVFDAVLDVEAAGASTPTREHLRWSVLAALPGLLSEPEFAALARYVASEHDPTLAFQLADRIAHVFDQYVTYRPEMIREWERGTDDDAPAEQVWQPKLWRALAARATTPHPAALERRFHDALSGSAEFSKLPRRLSVFGISSLPPLYVRALFGLARRVEVHLFLLSPSREFWEDLVTPRERRRLLASDGGDAHLHVGNPLLASLGKLGRDFQSVLGSEAEALGVALVEAEGARYVDPPGTTALGRLQGDLLTLEDRATNAAPASLRGSGTRARRSPAAAPSAQLALDFGASHRAPTGTDTPVRAGARPRLDAADVSLRLHSCHGPMREVEVLHDQLLHLLSLDANLQPRDIVVMTPSVDEYAPLIEAVFQRDPSDERFVPYRIADRTVRKESAVVDALHRILSLVGTRVTAPDVIDLLALDVIHRKVGIDPTDLDAVKDWVVATGIRWGFDAEHRARHGLPRDDTNTWRFGLDRLLLGYALPSRGQTLFEGVLPFDEIEGQTAELAGRLAEACTQLFDHLDRLEAPRTLPAWRDAISAALDALVVGDHSTAWQVERVREGLTALVEQARAAGFSGDVDRAVIQRLLDAEIDAGHPARGFLAGGVTFCAMVPMRSIPFRVVALLGMNDGAFPRSSRPVDFDLMARSTPRPGDRSRRDDDRYLFLEAMLAARDHLIITYTGQSLRDNSSLPPSVVVSELLDYVTESFDPPGAGWTSESERAEAVRAALVVTHPLQPFSPRYFDGAEPERLFSHHTAYLVGARAVASRSGAARPFFTCPLPAPEGVGPTRVVTLAELVAFFSGPLTHLLRRRLGLNLRDEALDVPDADPLQLDHLESYGIGHRLLTLVASGCPEAEAEALLRGSGLLPRGALGRTELSSVFPVVRAIAGAAAEHRTGDALPPFHLQRELPSGVMVSGEIGGVWPRALVRAQYANVAGKHLVSEWVRHLALSCCEGGPGLAVIVGRTEAKAATHVFSRVANPEVHLDALVGAYLVGRQEPLLFFPSASLTFAQTMAAGATLREARDRAAASLRDELKFEPTLQRLLDGYSPGDVPPWDTSRMSGGTFEELAVSLAGPLAAHLGDG